MIEWLKSWSLSEVADWASIVSLGVSAFAVYSIRRVRAEIIARATLPNLLLALEKHAKSLSQIIEDEQAVPKIRAELFRCEANLRTIHEKLPRRNRSRVRALIRRLEFQNKAQTIEKSLVWSVYAELNGIVQELDNFLTDQRVGR